MSALSSSSLQFCWWIQRHTRATVSSVQLVCVVFDRCCAERFSKTPPVGVLWLTSHCCPTLSKDSVDVKRGCWVGMNYAALLSSTLVFKCDKLARMAFWKECMDFRRVGFGWGSYTCMLVFFPPHTSAKRLLEWVYMKSTQISRV